jgi:hypothetical protein
LGDALQRPQSGLKGSPSPRHGVPRMLAVMHARGSIGAAARQAALELHAVILTGSRPVLLLLGALGEPAGPCLVHVLGLGWPIKQWAAQGWKGESSTRKPPRGSSSPH